MGVDSEKVRARGVHTSDNEVCADVALVAEEVLLQHCHARHDAGLAAGGEAVELQVGRDDGGCEFGIGSGTCTGTPDLRGNVMKFLAVLDFRIRQSCTVQ